MTELFAMPTTGGIVAASTEPASVKRAAAGVLGATGYAGQELVRLLAGHPNVRLAAAGSRQQPGRPLTEAFPWLDAAGARELPPELEDDAVDPAEWRGRGIDLVFSALPHGAFAPRAKDFLSAGLTVIDLSADFRPGAAAAGSARPARGSVLYGLTEWVDWPSPGDQSPPCLIANPGCYATAVLLAALPAVRAGWWSGAPLVINALSGVSGAGRAPSLATHFAECGGGAALYRVGETHPHRAEISAMLADHSGGPTGPVVFNPHLVPMTRGIVVTLALPLSGRRTEAEAAACYAGAYAATPFVRLLTGEALPETRHVRGSNRCDLALRVVADGSLLLVFAAIDNLMKGAAGQAVQNMNRLRGYPEATGLPREGWPNA